MAARGSIHAGTEKARLSVALQNLSVDTAQAIEFAESEFAKGTRFWPRLIVRCLEEIKKGNALEVAECLYVRTCEREVFPLIEPWFGQLRMTADVVTLRDRSIKIWDDSRCQSLMYRGITRLFNAKANFLENKFDDYEIELTRAIGMLTATGDATVDGNEFVLIMRVVRKALER